jgi:Sas10/Utp3/C1D family.
MSYIDVKFSLLAFYSMNLAFYILLKVQGKPVKGHPVIRRLIYIKTLLSKLKPIDKKLDYQITKLLRLANRNMIIVTYLSFRGNSYWTKVFQIPEC